MDPIIQALRAWGCDIDGAMERFLDDEGLYLSLMSQVTADPAFEHLGAALEQGDAEAAFEAAHALKGVLGNMGLTPMYDLDCQLVEPLRRGQAEGLEDTYKKLVEATKC